VENFTYQVMKQSGVNPTEVLQEINKLKETYIKLHQNPQPKKVN